MGRFGQEAQNGRRFWLGFCRIADNVAHGVLGFAHDVLFRQKFRRVQDVFMRIQFLKLFGRTDLDGGLDDGDFPIADQLEDGAHDTVVKASRRGRGWNGDKDEVA